MKKIVYITGTRADYGLMSSVLREIHKSPELELHVIATGMHLQPEFGETIKEVKKDNYKLEVVDEVYETDKLSATPIFMGKFIQGLTKKLEKIRPDVVMVIGDRAETMAGALAGLYMNIPVAQISAGDLTGNVDDAIRHAITKIANVHFPLSMQGAEIVHGMRENWSRIFVVGATSLDNIRNAKLAGKKELFKKYKAKEPYVIVVLHTVTAELEQAEQNTKNLFNALEKFGVQAIVSYPNADAGGQKIIKVIKEFEKKPFVKAFKNIPYLDYLGLLNGAAAIVGNSSSAIIESAGFGIPAVNIGTRQRFREHCENVLHVGYSQGEIEKGLEKALNDKNFREKCTKVKSPYGNGTSGKKIAKVLERLQLGNGLIDKNSMARVIKPKFKRFNELKPKDISFDWHTHTTETDGQNRPEEMVAMAKEKGLSSIAFTDHLSKGTTWFPEFRKVVSELRLNEEIEILSGFEAKPLDFGGTLDAKPEHIANAELIVASPHRYPDGKGGVIELEEIGNLEAKEAAKIELKAALGLLKNPAVDVIGHPFGIYSNFFEQFPENEMETLFRETAKTDKAIEINTRYIMDKEKIFKLLAKHNPFVSLGSDAHNMHDIAHDFETVKKVLK